jgi:hypothetical protein
VLVVVAMGNGGVGLGGVKSDGAVTAYLEYMER